MKPIYIVSLFILVALAQLYIPASMIFQQEKIIETGTPYKFKTQPVDPSDPFKGKYIYLNYEINSVLTTDTTWVSQAYVYVLLANDSLGYAKVASISKKIPTEDHYIKANVDYYNAYDKQLNFTFPFNEFYMNEAKAYDAEVAHTKAQRDSLPNNTYGLVYVLNGKGVLDNVFINDIPISKYVEKKK